jgi:hypothetical protein
MYYAADKTPEMGAVGPGMDDKMSALANSASLGLFIHSSQVTPIQEPHKLPGY